MFATPGFRAIVINRRLDPVWRMPASIAQRLDNCPCADAVGQSFNCANSIRFHRRQQKWRQQDDQRG
jgi:hypothetical protein